MSSDRFEKMYDEFYTHCLADRPTGVNDHTVVKTFPKSRATLKELDRVLARKYENDFRIFVESLLIARQYFRVSSALDKSLQFVSRNQTHIQALKTSMWASTRDKVFGSFFGREEILSCHMNAELV